MPAVVEGAACVPVAATRPGWYLPVEWPLKPALAARGRATRGERMTVAGYSTPSTVDVPVAQLDKASDYESEDWGFKSLQG